MKIDNIKPGMPVAYIPQHLIGDKDVKDCNLGIISSVSERYVFVRYKTSETAQATDARDLFTLDYRPDLIERLGLEVKPINRVCELYLQEKAALESNLINNLEIWN